MSKKKGTLLNKEIFYNYKYSIKQRIASTYAIIFLITCIVTLMIFCVSYAYQLCSDFPSTTAQIGQAISEQLEKDNNMYSNNFIYFLSSLKSETVHEIFISDTKGNLIVTTSTDVKEKQEYKDHPNVIFALMPEIAVITNRYYIDTYSDSSLQLDCYVYYYASDQHDAFMGTVRLMFVAMTLGFLIFLFAGSSHTNNVLKPIDEITEVTKKISGENLNLRISEKSSKSELNELAGTINDMMDRIQASYEKQKQFVSDVSHELRTPISVISGYGSMLKRWGKSDQVILDESIEAIINEADNMKELVDKLLFLTRHDNHTLSYNMAPTDISKLCEDIVRSAMMVKTDFTFTSDIAEDIYAVVDETRIRQIFRILIDNAEKYSRRKKQIQISLYRNDISFYFSVKDNGVGIPKEKLAKIFDRFYRADESRTKESGGYGLGLSIAKIVILGHHGSITVRSKEGEGSTFTVQIPLKYQENFHY